MLNSLISKWKNEANKKGAKYILVVSDLILMETKPEYFTCNVVFQKRLNDVKKDDLKKVENILEIA